MQPKRRGQGQEGDDEIVQPVQRLAGQEENTEPLGQIQAGNGVGPQVQLLARGRRQQAQDGHHRQQQRDLQHDQRRVRLQQQHAHHRQQQPHG
ncbi:hypothetical protein [Achromobacter aegrifaciens]